MDKKNENDGIRRYTIKEMAALDEAGVEEYVENARRIYERNEEEFTEFEASLARARVEEAKRMWNDKLENYEIDDVNYANFQEIIKSAHEVATKQDGRVDPLILDPIKDKNGHVSLHLPFYLSMDDPTLRLLDAFARSDSLNIYVLQRDDEMLLEFCVHDIFKRIS